MAAMTPTSKSNTVYRCLMACLLILELSSTVSANEPGVTVFAAASLTEPLQRIAQRFFAEHRFEPRFSFAASSTLAKQIELGAPADIYFSANRGWMDHLSERGLVDETTLAGPISNVLVVAASVDSPTQAFAFTPEMDFDTLLGPNDRIAVGDPDHVPVGIYTKQALKALNQWEVLAPRLARTDNTRAALALIERGETPFGFVYKTDALASTRVKILTALPDALHEPIRYTIALVGKTPSTGAKQFYGFLLSEEAISIFHEFGFR